MPSKKLHGLKGYDEIWGSVQMPGLRVYVTYDDARSDEGQNRHHVQTKVDINTLLSLTLGFNRRKSKTIKWEHLPRYSELKARCPNDSVWDHVNQSTTRHFGSLEVSFTL